MDVPAGRHIQRRPLACGVLLSEHISAEIPLDARLRA